MVSRNLKTGVTFNIVLLSLQLSLTDTQTCNFRHESRTLYPHAQTHISPECAYETQLTHWAFACWFFSREGQHVQQQSCVSPDLRRWRSRGSSWADGEMESIVPAGARQQCMIIGLVLWSAFCFRTDGPWPLTSSHSRITIPLRWSPNSPSISLLRLQLLLASAHKRFTADGWEGERGWRERGLLQSLYGHYWGEKKQNICAHTV